MQPEQFSTLGSPQVSAEAVQLNRQLALSSSVSAPATYFKRSITYRYPHLEITTLCVAWLVTVACMQSTLRQNLIFVSNVAFL
jgi:hypothetical protein